MKGPFVTAFPVSPPLLAENGLSSEPSTEAFFFDATWGTWQGTARLVEHDLNLAGGAAAGTPSYTDLSTSIFSSATLGAQMVRAH